MKKILLVSLLFVSQQFISQTFQNLEPGFQIFQIPDPRKSVLGPGDVFGVSKNHRSIYHFENFL